MFKQKRTPADKAAEKAELEGVNQRLDDVEVRLKYVETQIKLYKKAR